MMTAALKLPPTIPDINEGVDHTRPSEPMIRGGSPQQIRFKRPFNPTLESMRTPRE
jgi:hypothetical protein